MELSEITRDFWNKWPCDGQSNYETRAKLRYSKEPFIIDCIRQITKTHQHIVEVGCGQGTDAITACQYLGPGASYIGIDASDQSIANAEQASVERSSYLEVIPQFTQGDALALTYENNSLECIYSMGVLHHTTNTQLAIDEIYRVLRPGGRCYIFLYRTASPKLLVAHTLRALQLVCDKICRQDRCLLKIAENFSFENALGTMLIEACGVPIMRSYSSNGIKLLFAKYSILKLRSCGFNWPFNASYKLKNVTGKNKIGNFFYIVAQK